MTPPSDTDVRELVVPLNDAQMRALDTLVRIGIYDDNVGEVATFLIMRELQDLHHVIERARAALSRSG